MAHNDEALRSVRTTVRGTAERWAGHDMSRQTPRNAPGKPITHHAVSRFPLVCRPRLTCPDLEARIADVQRHANACEQQAEPADQRHRACVVWNLAALIAADCGVPALAADLCERQFRIFHARWPAAGRAAVDSLQPLVNLARLTGRAGDPSGAYRELHSLYWAVQHGGSALIHSTTISFDRFTAASEDRRVSAAWLRPLLLQDGTRLLASTGHWTRAAAHAAMYDDAGERLHDARQTQVVARLHDGHTDSALTLLDASMITEPWERAAAACLRSYSDLRAQRLTTEGIATMLAAVRHAGQSPDQDTAFFRFRLGLTAVDLASEMCPGQAGSLCTELVRDAASSDDAFAAREVLRHEASRRRMTPAEAQMLSTLVRKAGLGRGAIPPPLLADLMGSVEIAETVLARTLDVPT